MNRRQFLSRAALAFGGVLLAPLVGAVKGARAADDGRISDATTAAWREETERERALEAAFAEDVEPWDFPSGEEEGGFDTAYTPLIWNHTSATANAITVSMQQYTGVPYDKPTAVIWGYWNGDEWVEGGDF